MSPGRALSRLVPRGVVDAIATTLVVAGGASAAQRVETFALPSTHGNIDERTVVLNGTDHLDASVLLPDGYDERPAKAWPVVYLLSGIGDNSQGWLRSGELRTIAAGLPAIVVMPESGRGFDVDWWQDGARSGPRWAQYFLDDVIPTVESRYRILPGREDHAIAGSSMGGYGAALLGGLLPGYFGSIVSLSGMLDSQSLESYTALPSSIGASYETVWGPVTGPYATVTNPLRTLANVAGSRMYVATGSGIPDPTLPAGTAELTGGLAIEAFVLGQSTRYAALASAAGNDVTLKVRAFGIHAWPYWRRELPKAIAWNLFAAPPVGDDDAANARGWSNATMQQHGNAWGLGYQFAAAPTTSTAIARRGQVVTVTGGSGTITINPGAADADASGAGSQPACSFTATIPVTRTLPAGC